MANVVFITYWEAQPVVDNNQNSKGNKYQYHVNMNHGIGTLKDRFIIAMLQPNSKKRNLLISHILALFFRHSVPTRPDCPYP